MSSDVTAEDIAEELLYRTGKTLEVDDLTEIARCFVLPQYLETLSGNTLIKTEEEVVQLLSQVRQYYLENKVSDSVRTVVSANFLDPDTIGSTHVTRLMREDGELFRAPFPVYSILRRVAGEWKIASCSYAILDAPDHNEALTSVSTPQTFESE